MWSSRASEREDLETSLGDILLGLASPEIRIAVAEESEFLRSRYAGDATPATLRALAAAFDACDDVPPKTRLRLRLWAATLRHRAAEANPTEAPAGDERGAIASREI